VSGQAIPARAAAALAATDWQTAYCELQDALTTTPPNPDTLDAVAQAAWWLGRMDECIEARERAYAGYEAAGDRRRAGHCAVWLFEHECFKSRPAVGMAWLQRARRLLAREPESVEFGNLLLREALVAHGGGDLDGASAFARRAADLGRRLGSADLEGEALQELALVLIRQGRVVEGMSHFDEAMLLAVDGKLGPYSTGRIYCSLISACEELGDLRRAAEWTETTERWAEHHPFAVFPGICRVHHAGVLDRRGLWNDAEREARRACEELEELNLPMAAVGYSHIGELRRRLGDFAGAEAAFRRAEALSAQPLPGLALLRLSQGRLDAATAIIERALIGETWNRLARARLLPTRAQIAIATDDLEAARGAADELEAIAGDYPTPLLWASAASTRGRVELAQGSAPAAAATLQRALETWREVGVAYEAATVRFLLGRACQALGDSDGATTSFTAAATEFERLGAVLDAHRARVALGSRDLPAGLTAREAEVLRLLASGCTNKAIAAELHLSDKTVARHVANIFVKLGVSTRSAATAFAYEHGLVGR
jgi:ATP/maltotriose-dependent transcriptional regulator MalT